MCRPTGHTQTQDPHCPSLREMQKDVGNVRKCGRRSPRPQLRTRSRWVRRGLVRLTTETRTPVQAPPSCTCRDPCWSPRGLCRSHGSFFYFHSVFMEKGTLSQVEPTL